MTIPLDQDKQPTGVALDGEGDGAAPDTPSDKANPELDELKQQLAQVQANYNELRSHADRTSGENATLKGLIDALKDQQPPKPEGQSQEEFDKQWREKMQEDPAAAIDFFRGTVSDLRSSVTEELKAQLAELQQSLDPIRSKLADTDPEYLANKDTVDELMTKVEGLTRQQAIAIAKAQAPAVHTPGASPAPGAMTPGATAPGGSSPPPEVNLPPEAAEILRQSGIDSSVVIKEIQKELKR